MRTLATWSVTALLILLARLVTAVRAVWQGCAPASEQRIYFANHRSHGDFLLAWAVLPPQLRRQTRPVAGADYWLRSALRRFVIRGAFDAVLIERDPRAAGSDPVGAMASALDQGSALILFPEGTRNTTDAPLLAFRTGLYHLARMRPGVPLVPVWIDNLDRVLPKGAMIPVPQLCSVTFGRAIRVGLGEDRDAFLARARDALLATAPQRGAAS